MKYIIASGPVIIENGKVLLNKHGKDDFFKFIGGQIKHGESLEQCAVRRAKEEMGVDVKLIKPIKPMIVWRKDETVILIHYLAKRLSDVKPADFVKEWAWVSVKDILDGKITGLGENIKPVIKEIQKK